MNPESKKKSRFNLKVGDPLILRTAEWITLQHFYPGQMSVILYVQDVISAWNPDKEEEILYRLGDKRGNIFTVSEKDMGGFETNMEAKVILDDEY